MTDIVEKALALVNEVLEGKALNNTPFTRLPTAVSSLVLLRALEQHEAFKQEVSDALLEYYGDYHNASGEPLERFIIPKPKPDPLERLLSVTSSLVDKETLRDRLEAEGLEIREKGQ